ncbi:hypothetical protein [Duodenibacillus massiliensis]|uniref:hypothetical protein n=1 Tax=Duodenibacillus massiliensis TaxID=1852381 RepID=UPI003F7D0B34
MAHRTPKINDTVKFTDQQQAILNDAVEQLMEAGGLTALTQAHFNEAMKRRPINGPIPEKAPGGLHTAKFSRPS